MIINSRIQIENGAIEDFYAKWGFIYIGGDRRFAPPEKKRDTSSYIEQPGVNEDSRTVDDEFDYTVRFLIEAPNRELVNVNCKIHAWNEAVRERITGSDIKRCRTVTFYDDKNRCKITGIPEIIADVDEDDYFPGEVMDAVVVELKIHVSNPNLCYFNTKNHKEDINISIGLSLETDGDSLFVNTSRPLKGLERLTLLRCGRKASMWTNKVDKKDRYFNHSKYRWHVTSYFNSLKLDGNKIIGMDMLTEDGVKMKPISHLIKWDSYLTNSDQCVMRIRKAGKSWFIIPVIKGKSAAITYGIAVYDRDARISEVMYFKSNVLVLKTATPEFWDNNDSVHEDHYTQYLTIE